MPATGAKGILLDVGGVLLPTPWELLEDFEALRWFELPRTCL